jgi:hypothetical protein
VSELAGQRTAEFFCSENLCLIWRQRIDIE